MGFTERWAPSFFVMRIRDPIHGTIGLSESEGAILDSRPLQRLRYVRQLGFGDLAFPGATHSRHSHSLGAMHLVGRLFDAVFASVRLAEAERARLRQAVRIAALCHDLGHMPLSHASEQAAPPKRSLALPAWCVGEALDERAGHELFTAKLLLDSSLTSIVAKELAPMGLTPEAIVSLVLGEDPPGGSPFVVEGRDFTPLLRQFVSGEIDGDRMDYLQRDSFYTGVAYGRFDLEWMLQNLTVFEGMGDGRVYLGLSKAAIFAFEDFLLSRFHMFMSVYFHHTSVCFDEMLKRFYDEEPEGFAIPSQTEQFLGCDDVALTTALRASRNRWAGMIVARRGYRLVLEATPLDRAYDLDALTAMLTREGIDFFRCESLAVLSRYFLSGGGPSLFVVDADAKSGTPIADYTPLYKRYGESVKVTRLYCERGAAARARELIGRALAR